MRYIKQVIHSEDGYVHHARLRMWGGPYPVSVITHDTERNSDSISTVYSLKEGRDLGYGYNADHYVVVALNGKHLQFHRYVESVVHGKGVPSVLTKHEDYVLLKSGTSNLSAHGVERDRTVVINTESVQIDVFGTNGSVCTAQGSNRGLCDVYTLYELIGQLCHETRLNLMSYGYIQIHNEKSQSYTAIKLIHNAESDRFFTKMYMDVVSR